MEGQLLRVPLEELSKEFRLMQKRVEREMQESVDQIMDPSFRASEIPAAVERIARLRREVRCSAEVQRLESYERTTARTATVLQERLDHIGKPAPPSDLIAEFLIRNGQAEAARTLIEPEGVAPTVDAISLEAIQTASSDLARRRLGAALRWAQEHGSRLRRMDSPLEFELRVQEFVELVRSGRKSEALSHASEHLAPAARAAVASPSLRPAAPGDTPSTTPAARPAAAPASAAMSPLRLGQAAVPSTPSGEAGGRREREEASANPDPLQRLQQLMGLLAFDDPTRCGVPEVERLFHDDRWHSLRRRFLEDAFRAAGFPRSSRLRVRTFVGAAALKSPFDEESAVGGIASRAPSIFRPLREQIPLCRRSQTRLLCSLTGDALDDENRPLVLPTGYVVGLRAWKKLGRGVDLRDVEGGRARVRCPFTGRVFRASEVKTAYVG